MTATIQYFFQLQLSQLEFLRHYQGSASAVRVTSECGKSLLFPASRLRPFLTQAGIRGRFAIRIDAENRFVDLKKIS